MSGVRVDRIAVDGATITVDGGADLPICLTPTEVAVGASQPTAPVGGATTLFANSGPATDTAIRPSVTGVSSILQLRGAAAPRRFTWDVDLQPDLALKELPDGGVAVVVPAEPGTDVAGMLDPPAPPTAAEQRAALPGTAAHVSQDQDELSRVQSEQPDEVVALIRAPWAKDPQGRQVATSLRATGSQITMTVEHAVAQGYPVVAHMQVSDAVAADEGSAAKADFEAVEWTDADEAAFEESSPGDPSDPTPDPPLVPDDAPADDRGEDSPDAYASAEELEVDGPGEEDPDAAGADLDGPDATTAGERMSTLRARADQITVGTTEADVATEIQDPQSQQLGASRPRRPMVHWNIAFLVGQENDGKLANTPLGRCKSQAARKWTAYADAARKRHVSVMPTFNLKIGKTGSCGKPPPAPNAHLYRGAIAKFLQRYRFVKRITTLNEPNLNMQAGKPIPKASRPRGAPRPTG